MEPGFILTKGKMLMEPGYIYVDMNKFPDFNKIIDDASRNRREWIPGEIDRLKYKIEQKLQEGQVSAAVKYSLRLVNLMKEQIKIKHCE